MGEIRVDDDSGETRFVSAQFDGRVALRIRDGSLRLVVADDGTLAASDVAVVHEADDCADSVADALRSDFAVIPQRWLSDSPWWSLYVPTLLGACLLAGVSFQLFELLVPAHAGSVETALAACFVLTAWTGTSFVVRDADELRASDAAWQPTAWHYVVGGALVTTVYLLATAGSLPTGPDLLPVVAGAAIVGVATAAAVTGPLYLHRRGRRVGLD